MTSLTKRYSFMASTPDHELTISKVDFGNLACFCTLQVCSRTLIWWRYASNIKKNFRTLHNLLTVDIWNSNKIYQLFCMCCVPDTDVNFFFHMHINISRGHYPHFTNYKLNSRAGLLLAQGLRGSKTQSCDSNSRTCEPFKTAWCNFWFSIHCPDLVY